MTRGRLDVPREAKQSSGLRASSNNAGEFAFIALTIELDSIYIMTAVVYHLQFLQYLNLLISSPYLLFPMISNLL